MNGYRCIACDGMQTADFAGFVCPSCGGNLEITYDYGPISREIGAGFEKGNDLFRYAPLLPVDRLVEPFPLKIGATPLYEAARLGNSAGLDSLYLKDDTVNPSASIKDRASAIALQRAVEVGARIVAVASTGNAGSSTACVAAALGLQAIVFVPRDAPIAKLTQARAYGATVLAVRGNYDTAYELCLQACNEFGWFNRSTGLNAFTREGKKTCAYEIWEDLGRAPDRVVVPTGDGNILSGIWKGWRDLEAVGLIDRLPKIDAAQTDGSAAISNAVQKIRKGGTDPEWPALIIDGVTASSVADSISVDRPRDGLAAVRAIVESGGESIAVPDEEILAAVSEIAQVTGVFAEPAAAASWAATQRMVRDKIIDAAELVVCLVTGNGLKDVATVGTTIGEPLVIDADIDSVATALPEFGNREN